MAASQDEAPRAVLKAAAPIVVHSTHSLGRPMTQHGAPPTESRAFALPHAALGAAAVHRQLLQQRTWVSLFAQLRAT